MHLTRIQRIQDAIHGLMEFHGMETSILDVLRAKEVQRLRRVRQLGLAHLVFPAAEHSRLAHSLGAAYLAVLFSRHLREASRNVLVDVLQPGPSASRDLALAALCHDLGHGPLSHLWEKEVIGEPFDRAAWVKALGLPADDAALRGAKWHELVGQGLIGWQDGEVHQILEQQEAGTSERVRQILLGRYYLPYLPRLISADIDVDRCDFILRDAVQTGVAYGRFDLHWLISTATIGQSDGHFVVGFDKRKSLRVIEQFLIARRALYDTVYYHKTVRCAEGMVGLLLRRVKHLTSSVGWPLSAADSMFSPIRALMEGQALGPSELLSLDDYFVWVFIQHLASGASKDPTIAELARRVIARDLFRVVPVDSERLDEFFVDGEAYARLHSAVAPYSQGDPKFFAYFDRSHFRMFSSSHTQFGFFVDTDLSSRPATPFRDDERLQKLADSKPRSKRLFVPREAVESVRSLIVANS